MAVLCTNPHSLLLILLNFLTETFHQRRMYQQRCAQRMLPGTVTCALGDWGRMGRHIAFHSWEKRWWMFPSLFLGIILHCFVLAVVCVPCPTLCNLRNCSPPGFSMEHSRQEYWSGLLFPTPGDFPDPGIELMSLASPALAGRFSTTVPPGKPTCRINCKLLSRRHISLYDRITPKTLFFNIPPHRTPTSTFCYRLVINIYSFNTHPLRARGKAGLC